MYKYERCWDAWAQEKAEVREGNSVEENVLQHPC